MKRPIHLRRITVSGHDHFMCGLKMTEKRRQFSRHSQSPERMTCLGCKIAFRKKVK